MTAIVKARATPELAVRIWNLTKSYKGKSPGDQLSWTSAAVLGVKRLIRPPRRKVIIDNVSLSVKNGELLGIVGANGAGKTTLLKLLSCIIYPDAGGGSVNGYDILRERRLVRRSVAVSKAQGWLGLLWQLSGRENLMFRAGLCGISRKEAAERVDCVLDRMDLTRKAHSYSWEWSAGETQKFNLAATFICSAPLVMLDEPTSHLDPQVARVVREFIKQDLNTINGQTIIMSTHYLEEAELLCDRVALLHNGQILACDAPSALKRAYAPQHITEVRALNYAPELGERIKAKCGITDLTEHFEDVATGQVRLRPKWSAPPGDREALRRALEEQRIIITSINQVGPSLDDVYFQLIQEKSIGH
jgi:ABC-2 type transport system ATP-binding protein